MNRGPDRRGAPDLARASATIAARGIGLGAPLSVVDETESTNDAAKRGARAGAPHGATWLAESQTAGRGRQGRAWLSPRGENLLFSVLLRLACPPARVPPLSLVSGLAVRDAVARALGAARDGDVVVKWPNDVLVRGKKIAGVLVESALAGAKVEYVIVGIGINVLTRSFPDEVAALATSIALEGGQDLDRAEILADVLAGLARDVELVAHRGLGLVHARLTRHDALSGHEVESTDSPLRGTACGIDLEGRLLVRAADGTVTKVASGELRIRAT
ncbi:MAG TPA: biotin--[acetyl-CoA-carboxylase] ligase [Labilithrix sp.]|nr:biotin--[acetyl-CoA-carboxylase] ligase [Labilithrix sp.]